MNNGEKSVKNIKKSSEMLKNPEKKRRKYRKTIKMLKNFEKPSKLSKNHENG